MSCGRIALKKAKLPVDVYYASEIKENAMEVTQYNYSDTNQLGDVMELTTDELKKLNIDLLIGGSPCQDLSIAMKNRTGLAGIKSKLFFEYVRVFKGLNPKYFLLENVGGMAKVDKDIITEIMGVEPIKINSSLVSAQLRNRLYWTNIPGVAQPKDGGILLQSILDTGYTDREKARCILESESRPLTTPIKMFHRYYSTGFTTLIFKDKKHYEDCKKHYDENYKGMAAKDIICNSDIYDGVRYFNQNELERLQTIPNGYTKILNRNDAAGILGDGWTADVIAHILSFIK